MIVWIRKWFRKPGQRFVLGESVNHKNILGFRAKVIKVHCWEGEWFYTVWARGRNRLVYSVEDTWRDGEIA